MVRRRALNAARALAQAIRAAPGIGSAATAGGARSLLKVLDRVPKATLNALD